MKTMRGGLLVVAVVVVIVAASHAEKSRVAEKAAIRHEARLINAKCAPEHRISRGLLQQLQIPIKLSVIRQPPENVKCYARCMLDGLAYYSPEAEAFDVQRVLEVSTSVGFSKDFALTNLRKCERMAWTGARDCEDYWNFFKCFQGSV